MDRSSVNPASIAVNLVIGWFFMSFLQSLVRPLLSGSWAGLGSRFRAIAFFHDGRAALVNIVVIVGIGIVANVLWQMARHR
jgi:hypothetical protein